MEKLKKIVVGIAGASGSIYAKVLLDKLKLLQDQTEAIGVIMSENAKINWELEISNTIVEDYGFDIYAKNDFNAPFASGSAKYETMIICPCSAGVMGRVATGISNDLMTRAADVILKERRKLIMVLRETPLSLIHINNMQTVTQAGGIVCPAIPSFYGVANTKEALAGTVVDRVLDLVGFELETYRWGSGK